MKAAIFRGLIGILILFPFSGIFPQGFSHFSYKSESFNWKNASVLLETKDGSQGFAFCSNDSLLFIKTSAQGSPKDAPVLVTTETVRETKPLKISGLTTSTGRLVLLYTGASATKIVYSDDNGASWSLPANVRSTMAITDPSVSADSSGKLWISGFSGYLFSSSDDAITWAPVRTTLSIVRSLAHLNTKEIAAFTADDHSIRISVSSDGGGSWTSSAEVVSETEKIANPAAIVDKAGTVWLFYQVLCQTSFNDVYQYDIYYKKSTDKLASWSAPIRLTKYAGDDFNLSVALLKDRPCLSFVSDRYNGKNQIFFGLPDAVDDSGTAAVIYKIVSEKNAAAPVLQLVAYTGSDSPVTSVSALYSSGASKTNEAPLYDDGQHGDANAGDNIWGGKIEAESFYKATDYSLLIKNNAGQSSIYPGGSFSCALAVQTKWMCAGSLNNFYSSFGVERECETGMNQQGGMQWPAVNRNQDSQVSKFLWIGTKDFKDMGTIVPFKTATLGPRRRTVEENSGDFIPVKFYMKSKYPRTKITVNGNTVANVNPVDSIDMVMPWDAEIYNEVNTSIGLTMKRRIIQFSQQYNDNYIISEYTFTNTGNTDLDSDVELTDNTLNDVRIFMGYRMAMNKESRYIIGNSSGWGVNTTIDTRGDGLYADPAGEDFRAQFAWAGKYTASSFASGYDNLGAPVVPPIPASYSLIDPADTSGRLLAPQFMGIATLYAQKSAAEKTDDASQPALTKTFGGDSQIVCNPGNPNAIYDFISGGHDRRHLEKIGESLNPYSLLPQKDPSAGSDNGAGYSFGNGYGPYTLKHGESITIVLAEATAGLSREKAVEYGHIYKQSLMKARTQADFDSVNVRKNRAFFTGKDSLFQTFRRARANFNAGWNIENAPCPPSAFSVNSDGEKVNLSWSLSNNADPSIKGFAIFRALECDQYVYKQIASLTAEARNYTDDSLPLNTKSYYYISTIGSAISANKELNIPASYAMSNPVYTVSTVPVAATTGVKDDVNGPDSYRLYDNYPNPFNPSTIIRFRLPESGKVTLKVYDILGKLVCELVNGFRAKGEYSELFSAQSLTSGIYFYELRCNSFISVHKMLFVK